MSGGAFALTVVTAACVAVPSLVAGERAVRPDGVYQANYAKLHQQHVASPKEMAEQFAHRQVAIDKKRAAGEDITEIVGNFDGSTAIGSKVRCGSRVPISELGFRDNFWTRTKVMLLQDPSFAQPKAGITQTLKDEGMSTMGTITAADKDRTSEPFLTVYKDGFSRVACATDAMYEYADKYGANADKYKDSYNVSIVKYTDIVLKEKQKPMSPMTCFEFCRSVPDMVYFGIRAGTDCYCTPFYDPAAASSERCEVPCEGDTTLMCGGPNEKSSMFEMHMCDDTASEVLTASEGAAKALKRFFDATFVAHKVAQHLERVGGLLQPIAGSSGDGAASDFAQAAKEVAGALWDPAKKCKKIYDVLLKTYTDAEEVSKADFTFAKELAKADYVIQSETMLSKKMGKCTQKAEPAISEVYPFYSAFMTAPGEKEFQALSDQYGESLVAFHPVLWSIDSKAPPAMSSCAGKALGAPKPLSLGACARACSNRNRKPRCVAFQYYQVMEEGEQLPMCVLLEKIESVRSYRCNVLSDGLLQLQSLASRNKLRGPGTNSSARAGSVSPGDSAEVTGEGPLCDEVARLRKFSGLSCQSIFGKGSAVMERCVKTCEDKKGARVTAVCMSNGYADLQIPVEGGSSCFEHNSPETDQNEADFRLLPFGEEKSGPKIEGDVDMGGEDVFAEPYTRLWTP